MFELEKDLWKKLLAEFLASFIAVGAVIFPAIALREAGLGMYLFIMFTAGFGLAVAIWLFRDISGGHVNPLVTFGMMLAGKTKVFTGVLYWVAQLAGGVVAALYAKGTFQVSGTTAADLANYGTATPIPGYKDVQIMLAEALGAFIIMSVVYVTLKAKDSFYAGLMIGISLLVSLVMIVPVSNGALNPAREFGPMIVSNTFKGTYLWYYLVAPFVGAAVAAVVYYIFGLEGLRIPVPKAAKAAIRKK